MKYIAALTCLLLTTIAPTASALQGNDCAAKADQVKSTEREAFMESCLSKVEAPANVQEEERKHKTALCEQNAKNKHLQGNDKANYQTNCMTKNEAAVAAKATPQNVVSASNQTAATNSSAKSAPQKAAAVKQKEHKKGGKKKEKHAA